MDYNGIEENRAKAKADKEKELLQLRKAVQDEYAARDAIPILPQEKALATALHSLACHWNHTDGCSWFYDKDTDHDWNRSYSKHDYLLKARAVLVISDYDEIMKALKVLELLRH